MMGRGRGGGLEGDCEVATSWEQTRAAARLPQLHEDRGKPLFWLLGSKRWRWYLQAMVQGKVVHIHRKL